MELRLGFPDPRREEARLVDCARRLAACTYDTFSDSRLWEGEEEAGRPPLLFPVPPPPPPLPVVAEAAGACAACRWSRTAAPAAAKDLAEAPTAPATSRPASFDPAPSTLPSGVAAWPRGDAAGRGLPDRPRGPPGGRGTLVGRRCTSADRTRGEPDRPRRSVFCTCAERPLGAWTSDCVGEVCSIVGDASTANNKADETRGQFTHNAIPDTIWAAA